MSQPCVLMRTCFLDEIVRFVGDEVAVVAAESETLAEDALRLIRVEYEVLPAVFDAEEALRPDAQRARAGEPGRRQGADGRARHVAEALTRATVVFEGTFRTQIHAPVGMETRAALAEWQGAALTVWKTSRAVHANDRQTLAHVLGIAPAQVRVICTSMGGGFGNKTRVASPYWWPCWRGRRDAPCAWNTAAPKSLLPGGIGSRPSRTCASVWSRTGPRRLSPCAAS